MSKNLMRPQPEPIVRRSRAQVTTDQDQPCGWRGGRLGEIDCKCAGKPVVYGCTCSAVASEYCLIHAAAKPYQNLMLDDGRAIPMDAAARKAMPVCAFCKQQQPLAPTAAAPPRDVAVIVTCHNYGRYLRQCVDSILTQTVRPAAIVIVDDSSTDATPEIAAAYAAAGVRYVRVDVRDVAAARNAGVAAVEPPAYYLFVDADNWLPANYLQTLQAGMTAQSIGVTYCHLDQIDDDGRSLGRSQCIVPYSIERLRRRNLADTCSLVRRQAYDQAGGWRPNNWGLHDWDLWLRVAAGGWQFRLIADIALQYRVQPARMSAGRVDHWEANVDIMASATLTTVVTLFCGRRWNLPRWISALVSVDWPKENLHVVAVDNSNDVSFNHQLAYSLQAAGIRHTILQDNSRFTPRPPAETADSPKDRIGNGYAMNVHLARLYSLATRYLPAATAQVWSVEDDVIVPPDALRVLARELARRPQAAAVGGLIRSRFQDRLIAWRGGQSLREPPEGTIEVDATGAYCLLVPREDWDRVAWRPGATLSDRHPYYDWAMCHDLRRGNDRKIYCAGEVRCLHYQADGRILTV